MGCAMSPTPSSVYAESRVALLTQHGKEGVIASVLDTALGCRVERVTGYDTDLLGTFTRDIPRAGMQLSGLSLGLASEGSFGADPFAGMFPWNVEFLIFINDERGLELVGVAQGAANGNGVDQNAPNLYLVRFFIYCLIGSLTWS